MTYQNQDNVKERSLEGSGAGVHFLSTIQFIRKESLETNVLVDNEVTGDNEYAQQGRGSIGPQG